MFLIEELRLLGKCLEKFSAKTETHDWINGYLVKYFGEIIVGLFKQIAKVSMVGINFGFTM